MAWLKILAVALGCWTLASLLLTLLLSRAIRGAQQRRHGNASGVVQPFTE